jgi:hypothetical protein
MNIIIIKEIKVLLKTTRLLFKKKNAVHSKANSGEQFHVSYEKHQDEFVKI